MTNKIISDRSNAMKAAKRATDKSGMSHTIEKAPGNLKGWVVVITPSEDADEAPPKIISNEVELTPDLAADFVEMDAAEAADLSAAAEAACGRVAWADEAEDHEQSSEAIEAKQAERRKANGYVVEVANAEQDEFEVDDVGDGEAQRIADEEHAAVTVRDRSTGEVLGVHEPAGIIADPAQTTLGAGVEEPSEDAQEEAMVAAEAQVEDRTGAASSKPGIPSWYRAGRRFILCVEGADFPQSAPHTWAAEFARTLNKPVVVRDSETFEKLEAFHPVSKTAARKAERKADAGASPGRAGPANGKEVTFKGPEGSADGRAHANPAMCRREARKRGFAPDAIVIHKVKMDRERFWWQPKAV